MPIASKVRQKNLISKNGIFLTFSNAQFMFLHEKYALDIEESRKQQTYKMYDQFFSSATMCYLY